MDENFLIQYFFLEFLKQYSFDESMKHCRAIKRLDKIEEILNYITIGLILILGGLIFWLLILNK